MKILVIADEESQKIWDFFRKEDYADIDLVISCGDLKADYLSFIATMIAVPVLYVHGNHDDKYQYTEVQMERRIRRLFWKIRRKGGIDILVTHAPAGGMHDGEDLCHKGFDAFYRVINKYHPKYFVHGHMHMNYGRDIPREDFIGDTKVINAYERYVIEI